MIHADLAPLAVPLDTLDALPGNPRRGDVAAVVRSYAEFGQRKPIVARRREDGTGGGVVIAGNHQLAAARELGWDEIAVVWVDDDDVRAKAFALADNRTADLGSYDDEALAAMLADVAVDADLLAAASFSEDELAALTRQKPEKHTDDDDVPDPPAEPVTQPGDVWVLGEHRLICGDSTDPDVLATLLDGDRAAMVWTDPPYGVAYRGGLRAVAGFEGTKGTRAPIANDDLNIDELETFLRSALGAALAVSEDGASWYVAAPGGPPFLAFAKVLADLGVWRQTLAWVKDVFVLGCQDFHWKHEPLFYGWKPGAGHYFCGDRTLDTVWEIPRPKRSEEHPTMKPVELVARSLRYSSKPGAVVLDPFGGSGTTLIAAHGEGRRARLVELDPTYCDVICRRYQQHAGIAPLSVELGEQVDFA